jgi:hypothetical protein
MKPRIGFSTGAVAFGDFRKGLRFLRERRIAVMELSALRDKELAPLVAALDDLPLSGFSFVSFHAPSGFSTLSEREVVTLLKDVLGRSWPIIVHPDVLCDFSLWREFGGFLCVENMDKRKPIGRTVAELEQVFEHLPEASFCFDIGHARQVDPTMTEAALQLRRYRKRLRQVHMSEVSSSSKHEPMSLTAISAFQKVAHLIPPEVPIILESVASEQNIEREIRLAETVFSPVMGDALPRQPALARNVG